MDDRTFLGLELEGDGRSSFELVPHLARADGRLYGGAAVAVSVAAMEAESGKAARWTTVQFVGLAEMGQRIRCDTELLAEGRRTAQLRVTGTVDGRVIFSAVGATGAAHVHGLESQFVDPPDVPPADDCPAFRIPIPKAVLEARGTSKVFFKLPIEFREPPPDGSGRFVLWARVAGHAATAPMLGFLADFVPMGVARAAGRAGAGTSLDNTIRFGPPTDSEWVLVGLDPHLAHGGYGHGTAHLWAPDGTLVATASQTASMVFFD